MSHTPPRSRLFIGLMSGTSLDGIDAALVDFAATPHHPDAPGPGTLEIPGSPVTPRTLATHYVPFDAPLRAALDGLQAAAHNDLESSALAANALACAYAAVVHTLLTTAQVDAAQVEAIGAHGQTVRHRPQQGFTIQLNNAALLAELTGITVVTDFRSRDIAAGGQGAPLVPAFHRAVFGGAAAISSALPGAVLDPVSDTGSDAAPGAVSGTIAGTAPGHASSKDRVIVNIGGIANITHLPHSGLVAGFDTGPGNVLMDLWTQRHLGQPYDAGGAWAASGQTLPGLLDRLLAEPYFRQPPPKSTGRDLFHAAWLDQRLTGKEEPADVQATLCALTAHSIAAAVNALPGGVPAAAFVCGGGAHNAHLMRLLRQAAPGCTWQLTDALGVPADWVEAVAFAWLAFQLIERKPANLPQVTGAAGARLLGAIYHA